MVVATVFPRHLDASSNLVFKLALLDPNGKTGQRLHLGLVALDAFECFGLIAACQVRLQLCEELAGVVKDRL